MLTREIEKIAAKLKEDEESRRHFAFELKKVQNIIAIREVDEKEDAVIEDTLISRISEQPILNRVAGVDGGLLANEYHGIDLILTRAVGVLFIYNDNKLEKAHYIPTTNPAPEITLISQSLTDLEFRMLSGIKRQTRELIVASEIVKNHNPDILFLDGSIAPHPSLKPQKDSKIMKNYQELIDAYKTLYALCQKRNVLLAGVVEDSRANKFCNVLQNIIIPNLDASIKKNLDAALAYLEDSRDTHFLHYLMEKGERTFVFKYSKKPLDNPSLSDLGSFATQVYSFYLKTVDLDRPLRIDFLATQSNISEQADAIAYNLVFRSTLHSVYGIPAILIECDGRAKLSRDDIDIVYASISDKVGKSPSLMELRRNLRPF